MTKHFGAENESFASLDLCRGLAAVAVAAAHLRSFLFVDFAEGHRSELWWKVFYFGTGMGHQAVMVFFVLSGFFIGRSVIFARSNGTWSWKQYGIARLTRLWVVLLPALALTIFWDTLGISLLNAPLYRGESVLNSVPPASQLLDSWSVRTLLGNVFFLQTVEVPPFGTNGPLWSLSNEFWYYLLFPLGYFSFWYFYRPLLRFTLSVVFFALIFYLPLGIVLYGSVWLLGYMIAELRYRWRRQLTLMSLRVCLTVTFLAFAGTLVYAKMNVGDIYGDYACAAAFALCLYFLAMRKGTERGSQVSKALASFSYTLYLTHFPFMAFWSAAFFPDARLSPSLWTFGVYIFLLISALIYAALMFFLFESRTRAVQLWFASVLIGSRKTQTSQRS